MSEETKTAPEPAEKKGLRPASVVAAALAAVTAALLGAQLGVAGTVLGAGLASVITTVGGELYLRSLHRTREAAKKARDKLATAGRSQGGMAPVGNSSEAPTMFLPTDPSEMPTVRISKLQPGEPDAPEEDESFLDRVRKLRWPLILGTSGAAFAAALVVLFTVDWSTGGAANTGLFPRSNTSQQQETTHENKPTESQNAPATRTKTGEPTTAPSTSTSEPTSSSTQTTEKQLAPTTTESSSQQTTQNKSQQQAQTSQPSNAPGN